LKYEISSGLRKTRKQKAKNIGTWTKVWIGTGIFTPTDV
jgi:hypothetical protein